MSLIGKTDLDKTKEVVQNTDAPKLINRFNLYFFAKPKK